MLAKSARCASLITDVCKSQCFANLTDKAPPTQSALLPSKKQLPHRFLSGPANTTQPRYAANNCQSNTSSLFPWPSLPFSPALASQNDKKQLPGSGAWRLPLSERDFPHLSTSTQLCLQQQPSQTDSKNSGAFHCSRVVCGSAEYENGPSDLV